MEDLGRLFPLSYWVAMVFFLVFVGLCSLTYILPVVQSKHNKSSSISLPPSPPRLPIIGHLHLLLLSGDHLPQRTLQKLSKRYGPIMHLRFGSVPKIVVSSPEAAELFLKTHDLNFSNRPKTEASKSTLLGRQGMLFSDYGPHLRNQRKLFSIHLLSGSKMQSFSPIRAEVVRDFVKSLKETGEGGEAVNISAQVGSAIERIICRMIFGTRYEEGLKMKPWIEEALNLAGAFNLDDYFPFMKGFDLQGFRQRTIDTIKLMDDFLEMIILEYEQDCIGHQGNREDNISVMMSLIKSYNDHEKIFDKTNIKVVTMEMLGGSWKTSLNTINWAIKELLRHPKIMKQVQEELVNVIGMDRMVEETDLEKLTFLNMVVKETLRLHPFVPLIPQESIEDVSIKGFHIPKKSHILINVWAIRRDSNVWCPNAEEFYPERFTNNNFDVRGSNFQFIPFGSGHRKCPGIELGLRTVQFLVAQLVHCFNLKLPKGMLPGDVNMTETLVQRTIHLSLSQVIVYI